MTHATHASAGSLALSMAALWSRPLSAPVSLALVPAPVDLLVRFAAPARPRSAAARRPVNIAFVIDRSGSMSETLSGGYPQHLPRALPPFVAPAPGVRQPIFLGQQAVAQPAVWPQPVRPEPEATKLSLAKDAAWSAILSLGEDDRVSIVSFDDRVETLCRNVRATDRATLRAALDAIVPGNSTNLFDGWVAGARAVADGMREGALNRVALLTDGIANIGERSPDRIATKVAALAETGVSTSAFGVGLQYNEDLLQSIALSGDGNYYHIEASDDFQALFGDEFEGLASLVGRQVRLSVRGEGWAPLDCLNDFPLDELGRRKLPNLLAGRRLDAVFALAPSSAQPGALSVELSWIDPQGEAQSAAWLVPVAWAADEAQAIALGSQEAVDAAAELRVARAKKAAMAALDRGDAMLAGQTLRSAGAFMANASVAVASAAGASLESLTASLERGEVAKTRKTALYESYNTRSGKSR
jgi:Ca-activated chloride channel homolog